MGHRVLAIGDIHGCLIPLQALVRRLALEPSDTIIFLGDYIDRGPNSKEVIDFLILLKSKFNVVSILGNHEEMMIASRDDQRYFDAWIKFGGKSTLESYNLPIEKKSLYSIPKPHWEFMLDCTEYYETNSHIFTHATIDADINIREQNAEELRWNKFLSPDPHVSDKVVVCGHMSQKTGKILSYGHSICIDTFAHGGGWLTCLNTNNNKYFQANNSGKFQQGILKRNYFKHLLQKAEQVFGKKRT